MKSPEFAKDPARQLKVAKATNPNSPEVKEPTLKQIEDYLSQIDKIRVEKNLKKIHSEKRIS